MLHHCLGHRYSASLLAVGQTKVWGDVKVLGEPDSFCTGCTIAMLRKIEVESRPVSIIEEPDETLLMENVDNLGSFWITTNPHYAQYLLVVYAASRFLGQAGEG